MKTPAFYAKLIGLALASFCSTLTIAIPELLKGNYYVALVPVAVGLLTAVAYATDISHPSETIPQVNAAINGLIGATVHDVPALSHVASFPIAGPQLVSLAEGEADKVADALLTKMNGQSATALKSTGAPQA